MLLAIHPAFRIIPFLRTLAGSGDGSWTGSAPSSGNPRAADLHPSGGFGGVVCACQGSFQRESVRLLGFLNRGGVTAACHQGSARGHLINRLCLLVLIDIYVPPIPYIAMG